MLIQIRSWKTGKVIFELDKEGNTFKDTVEEAVRRGVNLIHADFSCVTLKGADLHGAKLYNASFANANLEGANLEGANLRCADLSYTDLCYAKLYEADLHYVDLRGANLTGANLRGANLKNAYILNAIFDNATKSSLPMACPETGNFIGYKKIWRTKEYGYARDFIVKLEIPEDAKRSSAFSNKCRCSKAKVLEIRDIESDETINEIMNINISPCIYKAGEYVYPDSFDECRWNECSSGIHFFMTEKEALEYC